MGDAIALRAAIDRLATDSAEVERRGGLGRDLARREYSHDRYLDSLATLYRSVAERRK